MKRNCFMVGFFIIFLLFLHRTLPSQETSVSITPDKSIYYLDSDDSPEFSIGADPGVVIVIEVATEKKILIDQESQKDENFYSSYYGNNAIGGEEVKADDKGEATYYLPQEAWEALTGKKDYVTLYYRAYVIVPSDDEDIEDEIKWGTLSVKNWEDAPSISVFKSQEVAKAYEHLKKAQKMYLEENYEDAAKEFKAAYDSYNHPDFIYNYAACYLKIAIRYFDFYVDLGHIDDRVSAKELEEAKKLVDMLRKAMTSAGRK
ncbi:MAG: hypothetical protein OEY25_02695 [Candidatus Aminicenantes bacterium]|nr:hypothetical protein [Candidatus Aminicenantes bacterium]